LKDNFNIKELYDVVFRVNYPETFFNKEYEENEIILRFDKIDIATINELKSRHTAQGTNLNTTLIYWDDPKGVRIQLSNGVISKNSLSIVYNTLLRSKEEISIPVNEQINIIGIDKYKLKYKFDNKKPYFLYQNGNKINKEHYQIKNNELILDTQDYTNLFLDYYMIKENQEYLSIGKDQFSGFLRMEAKTRLKDDKTGQEKTCVFEIPKLRIMSDLSFRLGKNVTPYVYSFTILGEPTGERHEEYSCKIYFLDTDIDAEDTKD